MASSSSSSSEPTPKRAAVTRTCGICKCDFAGDEALYEHVEVVHTKTWVKDTVCGWDGCTYATSARRKTFIDHIRTHTNQRPFKCKYSGCDRAFKKSNTLVGHIRTHTCETPYPCDQCNKAFTSSSSLVSHKRIHSNEKPYACDICDMAFRQSGHLSTHKRMHDGLKPYVCEFCSMAFTQPSGKIAHMRTHTHEKPYVCDVCNMSFAQSGGLVRHKLIHSGEKSFSCDICDMTFVRYDSLDRHKLTHTAPKCGYCGKRPISRDSLLCGVCDNAYSWQYHVKEKAVFSFLAEFDWRLAHFVRDQNVGCGVRRRPDGYMDLVVTVGDDRVLFIVEVDEHYHRRSDMKCEFIRLQEIQDRHKGALYVLRYNPDQKDGLSKECLTALSQRCINILDGEYEHALKDDNCAMLVEYIGYPEARVELCNRTWFQSQIELLSQHHVDDEFMSCHSV